MEKNDVDIFPIGWSQVLYSDIVDSISTNKKKINQKQYLKTGEYQVIDQGQEEVGGYTNNPELLISCNLPVIVFGDHTRIVKFIKQPFAAGADGVKVLQPKKIITPKLLEYFTRYLALSIKDKGYARHYQWVAKEKVGVPPLNEQYRIVQKIEELFSELDKGIESLKTARQQLKVYRQALLKHAFEGKLTEQWRKDNADKLETADELLARIQQAREERYQLQMNEWQASVEKWEREGSGSKKPFKPVKPKLIDDISREEEKFLFGLPNEWSWQRFGNMYAESVLGKMLDKKKNKGDFKPYLRNINVRWGKFKLNNVLEMRFEKNELKRYSVKENDLVICEGGEPGRCAIWKDKDASFLIQKALHRVRLLNGITHPEYIYYFIQFSSFQGLLDHYFTGTTIKHLTGAGLSKLPIPLCAFEEQEIIVQNLSVHLTHCEHMENDISDNIKRSEALHQSILKKAFSGKLVPQDQNDEPASELLKRIAQEKADREVELKAEKESAKKAKKKTTTTKNKASKKVKTV